MKGTNVNIFHRNKQFKKKMQNPEVQEKVSYKDF